MCLILYVLYCRNAIFESGEEKGSILNISSFFFRDQNIQESALLTNESCFSECSHNLLGKELYLIKN
jgi:hypothetical protein